jgi:hypothetical protein
MTREFFLFFFFFDIYIVCWLSFDLFGDRCCYSGMITSSRPIVCLNICCSISFFFFFFFVFLDSHKNRRRRRREKKKKKGTKWFLISHRSYLGVCVCASKERSIYSNSRRTSLIEREKNNNNINDNIDEISTCRHIFGFFFHLLINIILSIGNAISIIF